MSEVIALPTAAQTPVQQGVQYALRSDGKLVFSIGASRSGKSQFVLSQARHDKRLGVWDVEGEYMSNLGHVLGMEMVEGPGQLLDAITAKNGPQRIAYLPTDVRKDFDLFCGAMFNWGCMEPATVILEELAGSTNSGKLTGNAGILVSRGLKYGINIYGVVQRGQETAKSLMGNATVLNICRPNIDADAEYLEKKFGINPLLIPDTDLEMTQRYKDRSFSKGRIQFGNDGLPWLERLALPVAA